MTCPQCGEKTFINHQDQMYDLKYFNISNPPAYYEQCEHCGWQAIDDGNRKHGGPK